MEVGGKAERRLEGRKKDRKAKRRMGGRRKGRKKK